MTSVAFDPRAWNIFAGLCVAGGCGSHLVTADESGSDTSGGGESTESSTTLETTAAETDGAECHVDSDCPYSYYCVDNVCEYHTPPEAEWFPPYCYTDDDCEALELCSDGDCIGVRAPDACQPPDPNPILQIPVASLGLTFADVDADGAMELVIATQSELHVYESGSIVPLVSPRGLDSDSVDAMVGAPLDAMPGDDVVILFSDELRLHGSDGIGNFGMPTTSVTSWPDSLGLIAGEFDGLAPADLLMWGFSGTGVRLGSGEEFSLGDGDTAAATARSLDQPVAGFMLQRGQMLETYTAAGAAGEVYEAHAAPPYAMTSIEQLGDGFDVSSSIVSQEWTYIQEWRAAMGAWGIEWGLLGRVTAMAGGDFDGDGLADLGLIVDGSIQVAFETHDPTCVALYPFQSIAAGLAVGDHDGDGDDELAVRFEGGNVAILDGE